MKNTIIPLQLDICPITGLQITQKPEWTNIDLSEGYSVTFRLIGDRILITLPMGNSGKSGMKRLFEEREKFLKSVGLFDTYYVEIRDYSKIIGPPTREGRQQFVEYMEKERDRGNLLGYWGFNASVFIKWSMNIGTKLTRTTFPIAIVNNYRLAIENAVKYWNKKK